MTHGNHDDTTNESGKMFMEAMMFKLLKRLDSTDVGVKEIRSQLSTINQLVDYYSTLIKKLEYQINQLIAVFNQRKSGTLLSDTVQNMRNDGTCLIITTKSSKNIT